MKKAILAIVVAMVLIIGVGLTISYFSYQNKDVRLVASINASIDKNKSAHSKMWGILQDKAGVADEYKNSFLEIFPDMIKGRYSKGGKMMQWVVEHNPNFDTSLYKDLMVSIEAQRESFHNNQTQLIDLNRQREVLLNEAPSRWFLSDKEMIDIPVIIQNDTAETFETGREPNKSLFNRE